MYFRACWLTKRFRLTIYLALGVALTVLATLPLGMTYRYGHWAFLQMTPELVSTTWKSGIENTSVVLMLVLIFAAADLGALALGDDSKRRDLDFLLTRPKPRRYFIWTSWLAGLTQLVPLLVLPVLTSIFVLLAITRALRPGLLLQVSGETLVLAAVMFAVVLLLAVLTGSAQSGFQIAALLVVVFAGVTYARYMHWLVSGRPYLFYRGQRPAPFDLFHQVFPLEHLTWLCMVALAMPLIAQVGFERRDV